jgi:ABC-2 type transport system permease protein
MVKEVLQMKRDRLSLGIVFFIPFLELLLFGYAIQTEVRNIPTAVFDQSLSPASREMLEAFSASGYFRIVSHAGSQAELAEMMDRGLVKAGIVFPPDFARHLARGTPAPLQVVVDASDNITATQAMAFANSIGLLKTQRVLAARTGLSALPYDVRVRPWYNPDGITAYYMVPAILGIIVSITMMIMTSISIVRERERGTMEQLVATPVRAWELMVGKVLPRVLLGYVQITLALLAGVWVFDVPIRGSVLDLYLLTLFFITASLGLGILISNVARTQMAALQLCFFALLPSILLSGFAFPRQAMPVFIYWLSYLIPLTYYLDIIRGVMLKGIGWDYLLGQVAMLLAFSVVLIAASARRFRKRVA